MKSEPDNKYESDDKPLARFNFYRNMGADESIEGIVAEYNQGGHGRKISPDEVRLGPPFHCDNSYPEHCIVGWHFRARVGGFVADFGEDRGVFIYKPEGEIKRENLEGVLETYEEEKYRDQLSIRTARSNQWEGFFVSDERIIGYIQGVCSEKGWTFERAGNRDNRTTGCREIGYLTAEGFTYLLKEVPSPSRLVLYDQEGKRIQKGAGWEKHKTVKGAIGKPISEDIKEQEEKFYREYEGCDL